MTWPDLDPAHLICEVDGVSLVLDRRTGRMARLDAIAQFVIEQRDHFSSLDDAALIVAETLQHDSGHVAKGLEALQRDLGRLGEGSFTPPPIASGRAEVPTKRPVASWRFDALGSTIQVCCYNRELAKVIAPYFEVHAPTNAAPLASFHVWSRGGRYWVARDHEKVLARVELADAVTGLIAAITYELFSSRIGV